ncbi:MAG: PLP-dependent aspartate aminotransferase family protein [Pirellulaceae bacterium]
MKFRTRAIHVGNRKDSATGAVVPPIHVASTYIQEVAGEWGKFDYARSGNPTRANLEETMASLESAAGALAFSSGMAAIHAASMLCKTGDHILAGRDIYGGTYRLLHQIANRAGIEVTLVDTTDVSQVQDNLRDTTRLVWCETPGNPLMSVTDIAACAEVAHDRGALLAVDNTFPSSVLTRPLERGADIVMHSATKYLGGHSDVLGGILAVKDQQLHEELYFIQNATGAVLSAFDSFLVSRGIKTLDLRMRSQCESASRIARWLDDDPRVERVLYPGLENHPGHDIAAAQMDGGFGAMMSFEVQGGFEKAKKLVESTKLFQLAVSLGAVESLIEQPAAMSHASYAREDRLANGITDSLVRISIGLEDPEDLVEDLDQALDG